MKTIVVTGGTSGIGKATVEELLKLGHKVIVVAKESEKTFAEIIYFKTLTKLENVIVEFCDLADLDQVLALSKRLNKYPRIDVLINNAGLEMADRHESAQGFELTLAVNYLAPYYLTNLLLPKLLENEGARIVITSSLVEKWAKLDFEDLQMTKNYNPEKAYYRSKLALLLFSYDLARKYPVDQLTVNAFEPGITKTNFSRDFKGIMKIGSKFMQLFMHSPALPAKTAVYLALNDEVKDITGKNYYNLKQKESSKQSHDVDLAKRLMEVTKTLIPTK